MYDLLRRELNVSNRRQTTLSLVYFDIDNFKQINDKYGHIEGDEVLKQIGQSLSDVVREVDIPCRYGGDEFCLILPDCNIKDAKVVCQRLIKLFTAKFPDFSLSIGIAEKAPDKQIDGADLIKIADKKMYLAKEKPGCQIQI